MLKGFKKFVLENHPDPDSLIYDDYVFNELSKLAEQYRINSQIGESNTRGVINRNID